jgi:hypothetical protein
MKSFENEYIKLSFIDGIVHLLIKSNEINIDVAKSIVKERIKFSENNFALVLFEFSNLKLVKKEARDLLAKNESKRKLVAIAFYTKTKYEHFLINFLLKSI